VCKVFNLEDGMKNKDADIGISFTFFQGKGSDVQNYAHLVHDFHFRQPCILHAVVPPRHVQQQQWHCPPVTCDKESGNLLCGMAAKQYIKHCPMSLIMRLPTQQENLFQDVTSQEAC
jgi:hypothetical protein